MTILLHFQVSLDKNSDRGFGFLMKQ